MLIEMPAAMNKIGRWLGKVRVKFFIRVALVCMVLSYMLAAPLMGLFIVMEVDRPDDLCIDTHTSGIGVWLEEDGKLVCKFLALRVLFLWSLTAIFFSPIAITWVYLRRQMRRLAEGTDPSSPAHRRDRVARYAGICIFFVIMAGTAWMTVAYLL